MASYTFTLPGSTKSFTIKGPDGFTEAQARAIFDQQANAGSLVGFKPGDVLNSATQLAAGLPSAASQLTQTLSGVPGVGTTSLSSIASSATAAVSKVASVAKQTISSITNTISKTPIVNGINTADIAKQAPALTSMQNITPAQVAAGLSQAAKSVGQTFDQLTSTAGAGKYGFDATQLELAGIVKPGTQAIVQAGNQLADVLKSPAVFTGKNGINGIDDLLSSAPKQDAIQQNLMSTGLSALKQSGIPVDKLNPSAVVGTALNAAKSIPTTMAWAKGLPLPTDIKSSFDQLAKAGDFAANFSNQKINNAMKQEIVPIPAVDTVDRDTLNAAASRVVGNPKVPVVSYTGKPRLANASELAATLANLTAQIDNLLDQGIAIMSKTDAQRAQTNSYLRDIRAMELLIADFNQTSGQLLAVKRTAESLEPPDTASISRAEQLISKIETAIATIQSAIDALKRTLANSTV